MEQELRLQLLRASVRDRAFLKAAAVDFRPQDFPDKFEQVIARAAVSFYEKYGNPIGSLLRAHAESALAKEGVGAEGKKKLKALLDSVLSPSGELTSIQALVDTVKELKHVSFYDAALDEILTAHENHKLTAEVLGQLVERANRELSIHSVRPVDLFDDPAVRAVQRKERQRTKYPVLLIDELDEKIKIIGRGQVGLWLAPYSGGKGFALVHTGIAYALQGLNVLHFTLEDPQELVLDRYDANITGIAINKLADLPNKFQNRLKKMKEFIRGRVKIVDCTDGGWTVTQFEQVWEQLKQEGFTADVVIIDYDDEIECEKTFKGEAARRFEFHEIYKRLRRFASKRDVYLWTAAQTGRMGEGKKIITGKDAAEDVSKIRKVFLGIGIGSDPTEQKKKYLYVLRHRLDRSRFAVEIMSDFDRAMLYDREATLRQKHQTARSANGKG